jgi:hypothetical protein
MKNICWGTLHDQECDDMSTIPTVKGYRFASNERTDIRVFQYSTGKWGVQVTVTRDCKANSMDGAKQKARELLKFMMTKKD